MDTPKVEATYAVALALKGAAGEVVIKQHISTADDDMTALGEAVQLYIRFGELLTYSIVDIRGVDDKLKKVCA